jgi:hypothetical protein
MVLLVFTYDTRRAGIGLPDRLLFGIEGPYFLVSCDFNRCPLGVWDYTPVSFV